MTRKIHGIPYFKEIRKAFCEFSADITAWYLQRTPALTLQREKSGTPARGHYVKQANSLCRTSERQKPDRKCGENGKPTVRKLMSGPIPKDARSI